MTSDSAFHGSPSPLLKFKSSYLSGSLFLKAEKELSQTYRFFPELSRARFKTREMLISGATMNKRNSCSQRERFWFSSSCVFGARIPRIRVLQRKHTNHNIAHRIENRTVPEAEVHNCWVITVSLIASRNPSIPSILRNRDSMYLYKNEYFFPSDKRNSSRSSSLCKQRRP